MEEYFSRKMLSAANFGILKNCATKLIKLKIDKIS